MRKRKRLAILEDMLADASDVLYELEGTYRELREVPRLDSRDVYELEFELPRLARALETVKRGLRRMPRERWRVMAEMKCNGEVADQLIWAEHEAYEAALEADNS